MLVVDDFSSLRNLSAILFRVFAKTNAMFNEQLGPVGIEVEKVKDDKAPVEWTNEVSLRL